MNTIQSFEETAIQVQFSYHTPAYAACIFRYSSDNTRKK